MSGVSPFGGSLSSADREPSVPQALSHPTGPSATMIDPPGVRLPFAEELDRIFRSEHARIFAYVQRLCGEPDLAADLVQEAFVRLHRRGSIPESAGAWLVTVATNLLRNVRRRGQRRLDLIAAEMTPDAAVSPADVASAEDRARVRAALQRLAPRDQALLSLLASGYRYREMAAALGLHEASVGTLLARAKRAFVTAYGAIDDAP